MAYRRTENVVRRLAARAMAIIAAAGALAAEAGINAVQIAPVSQRAGVATGTVYRYFPSKTSSSPRWSPRLGARARRDAPCRRRRAGTALGARRRDHDLRGARARQAAGSPSR
jgi:AcrR family transcriptional regulator